VYQIIVPSCGKQVDNDDRKRSAPLDKASLDIFVKSKALRIRSSTAWERSRNSFCTRSDNTRRLYAV
jgi:type IV secretory pathway VirD2 relaxase